MILSNHMINYQTINVGNTGLLEGSLGFPYQQPHVVFGRLHDKNQYGFLFESKDISPIYGRLSLIGIDPVLKITGKDDTFAITALNQRGTSYHQQLTDADLSVCDQYTSIPEGVRGTICKKSEVGEETERSKQKNIVQIIRMLLEKFGTKEKSFLGLYGAFSYDVVRLFEDIGEHTPKNDVDDFTLFLYDTFVFFDHLKQKNEIIAYRRNTQEAEHDIDNIQTTINRPRVEKNDSYRISKPLFSLPKDDFQWLVELAKDYAAKGDLFEVVFSNTLTAHFEGDPFALYLQYRDANPSPYLFYFDFYTEQIVGASPEMMVRCENNIVNLRPISGTARRGTDPIEDHENMLALLSDPKERAELDMLIDLGRNDLSRVCDPGVAITDYRFVEKYSRVMHTVAHLSGTLRSGYSALDALIVCLNAGTLTGAPKVSAMQTIERHEKEKNGCFFFFLP